MSLGQARKRQSVNSPPQESRTESHHHPGSRARRRAREASLLSEAPDAPSRLARLGWDLLTQQHRPPTAQHGHAEEVRPRNHLRPHCSVTAVWWPLKRNSHSSPLAVGNAVTAPRRAVCTGHARLAPSSPLQPPASASHWGSHGLATVPTPCIPRPDPRPGLPPSAYFSTSSWERGKAQNVPKYLEIL